MKAAIDTSVLVAAYVATHIHHEAAVAWVDALTSRRVTGVLTLHALAEMWSVLTKLPLVPRIEPLAARDAVMDLLSHVEVAPQSPALYAEALNRCAARSLRSGAIFDALHLVAAEHAGADVVVTFNEKDFARLAEPTSPRISSPESADARALLASILS